MRCERCGADHLEVGVTAKEIPEEWCRGALVSEAAFQASLYRDAAAARDKHFAKVKELGLQVEELKNQRDGFSGAWHSAEKENEELVRLNDELQGILYALHLFVDVYEGKVLDQEAAQELIRRYAKRSEKIGNTILEIQESQKRNEGA